MSDAARRRDSVQIKHGAHPVSSGDKPLGKPPVGPPAGSAARCHCSSCRWSRVRRKLDRATRIVNATSSWVLSGLLIYWLVKHGF